MPAACGHTLGNGLVVLAGATTCRDFPTAFARAPLHLAESPLLGPMTTLASPLCQYE